MEKYKVAEHEISEGIQKIYRFENNYGASVVRHKYSYGYEKGLWELAVIGFTDSSNDFSLDYDTEITEDVLGHQTDEDVLGTLERIKAL